LLFVTFLSPQVRIAEQEGIVFIDEIDKIVNPSGMLRHGEC
jgi:ATP-dependent protease HslVU (ClpYQ) ATPase subunit